jgi:hypothetical protein
MNECHKCGANFLHHEDMVDHISFFCPAVEDYTEEEKKKIMEIIDGKTQDDGSGDKIRYKDGGIIVGKPVPGYTEKEIQDMVDHPSHYTTGSIEVIDFIEDQKLPYHLGNAIKYISRCQHKGKQKEDLKKAIWYLTRYLEACED